MQCVSGVGWEGHFSCFNPTDPTHSSHWSWPTKLTQSYRCSGHSSNQSSTVWHKKPGPAPHMTWWNWVLWPVSRTTTETCPVTWPETWYRYSTTPLTLKLVWRISRQMTVGIQTVLAPSDDQREIVEMWKLEQGVVEQELNLTWRRLIEQGRADASFILTSSGFSDSRKLA